MKEIRFDDLETLRAEIRGTFGEWSAPQEVSQALIDRFADMSGDHNWIHVDVERSQRESPFRTPIAHGMLTLCLFSSLPGGGSFEIVGHGNSTNYGLDRVRFLRPVPAGAEVQARARIVGAEAKAKGTLVVREVEVRVVGDDRPAMVCRPLILYMPPQ